MRGRTDGRTENDDGDDGTDGHRTDDDGMDDGTDRRTEDDNGDDGTDTTVRTDDIYSSKVSSTTLGLEFECPSVSTTVRRFRTPRIKPAR